MILRRPKGLPQDDRKTAGKFVAWNQEGTSIVAIGDTFAEVKAKAMILSFVGPRAFLRMTEKDAATQPLF